MFTGIVTAVGTILSRSERTDALRLRIGVAYDGLLRGESIAVDGACLTVADSGSDWFESDVVATTRTRTTLTDRQAGDRVNLERALILGDRLGGHWVQGHVDGVGVVRAAVTEDDALLVDLAVPADVWSVSIPHGSITVDGVSLTVNALPSDGVVQVSLVPHTRQVTTFDRVDVGRRVQVEGDVLGKYVQRMALPHATGQTRDERKAVVE